MELFGGTISSLQKGLTYSSIKQEVISNNVANYETPNFKAKEVTFKPYLDEQVEAFTSKRTNERHLSFPANSSASYVSISSKDGMNSINGNSVDVEKEMSLLAENTIYYNALTDRVSSKLNGLMNVVKGGR